MQNGELESKIRKIEEEIPYVSKLAEATIKQMNANSRLSNANANEREFLNEDYQRKIRTDNQELENRKLNQEVRINKSNAEMSEFESYIYTKYGIKPDSSMGGIVAGIIAKYSDEPGKIIESSKNELEREIRNLFNDFRESEKHVRTGWQSGKFW